jgi:hypothetical protein
LSTLQRNANLELNRSLHNHNFMVNSTKAELKSKITKRYATVHVQFSTLNNAVSVPALLKSGVLNNTQLVLLNTLCVLQQHTLCAKLDDHYILAHLNVFVNTQGVLNSTVRNGSVFCNTPFI